MSEGKKYTAGEAAAFGVLAPVMILGMVIAFLPIGIYAAWCDQKIWNWFGAPYLHLGYMSLWVSYGIGSWVRLQTTSTKWVEGEKTSAWKGITGSIFIHSLALLVAYVIHAKIQ